MKAMKIDSIVHKNQGISKKHIPIESKVKQPLRFIEDLALIVRLALLASQALWRHYITFQANVKAAIAALIHSLIMPHVFLAPLNFFIN